MSEVGGMRRTGGMMRIGGLALLAALVALAVTAAPARAATPKSWRVVMIAGDSSAPVFDNAVSRLSELLAGKPGIELRPRRR